MCLPPSAATLPIIQPEQRLTQPLLELQIIREPPVRTRLRDDDLLELVRHLLLVRDLGVLPVRVLLGILVLLVPGDLLGKLLE